MSLINDAFKDIEARKAVQDPDLQGDSVAEARSEFSEESALKIKGRLLASGAFVILCIGVSGVWVKKPRPAEPDTNIEARVDEIALPNQSIPRSSIQQQLTAKGQEPDAHAATRDKSPTVADSSTTEIGEQRNDQALLIDDLIVKARTAIRKNRLSRPQDDNALAYLAAIFSVDKNHKEALMLDRKVKDVYLGLIDSAIGDKRFAQARSLINRARILNIDGAALDSLSQKLAQSSAESLANSVSMSETKNTQSNSQKASKLDATAWTAPSKEQREREVLILVQKLIDADQHAQARTELIRFTTSSPSSVESRVLAIDMMVAASQARQANELMLNTFEDNEAYDYIKARIVNMQEGSSKAIEFLERKNRNAERPFFEKGFLAALYQKNKQHKKAYALYKSLVVNHSNDPRYLLGYGLSADALNAHRDSLVAYEMLLAQGHPDAKVLEFIRARVKVLNGQTLVEARAW